MIIKKIINIYIYFEVENEIDAPWPITDIQPELWAFRTYKNATRISYDVNPVDAIAFMSKTLGLHEVTKVIFLVHGFLNNINTPWLHEMKDIMLQERDQVVVIVGWGKGADLLPVRYNSAAANTETVGIWLSGYAKEMGFNCSWISIWGVGHSLGAHVLGFSGRLSKSFYRITGLDPAGPDFETVNVNRRLRKTDAKLVDVIHTDGYWPGWDPFGWIKNHYGTLIPLGTVDFYPNFGYEQPGCHYVPTIIACSHTRVLRLFSWSITNQGKFRTNLILDGIPKYGQPVDRANVSKYTVEMGYWADTVQIEPNNYYIETNSSEPWV